jgi:hypothetical protein
MAKCTLHDNKSTLNALHSDKVNHQKFLKELVQIHLVTSSQIQTLLQALEENYSK